MLRLSVRQVFRPKARVRAQGARGVIHGNAGRLTRSRFQGSSPQSWRQKSERGDRMIEPRATEDVLKAAFSPS